MVNLRIYYDDKILTKHENERYIIYNPINDKIINVNKHTKSLIDYIFDNKGNINFEEVKKRLKLKYNSDVSDNDIYEVIDKLKNEKILFESDNELQLEKIRYMKYLKTIRPTKLDTVYIHTTMKCNFNCSYCYNKNIINNNYKELTTNEWIMILNELKKLGVINFIFTGGEPLIRKDLKKLIKSIKDDKVHIEILTNGSLLKDRFYELIDYVDKFVVSLDSFDININSKNRSSLNYENIISTLQLFSKHYKNKIIVRTVITKNNINDVRKFSKRLKEGFGIENVQVTFIPNNSLEIHLVPEYKRVRISYKEYNNKDFNDILKSNYCGAASSIIAINQQGDIYPCQSLMFPELKISNILNENWEYEFENSSIRKQLQNISVEDISTCNTCSYRHICGAGCRAIAYRVYSSLSSHIEYLCENLKAESKSLFELSKTSWK